MLALEKLPVAADQAKLMGNVPVALPASATVPPEGTAYGPPAFATTGAQNCAGTTSLGQGFSCWTNVPPAEMYPPWARKGMELKLFSIIGWPGKFSGKR
jgi:hypothetical protein